MKLFVLILLLVPLFAPAQPSTSFVATVTGFRPESAEVEVRADSGSIRRCQFTPDTLAQKIAPGERDLKKAEAIQITEVAAGDRVLITLEPDSQRVRRIVVMSARAIASHDDAERLDWQKHGVAGIVAARTADRITIKNKSLTGAESDTVVAISAQTSIKRYLPGSVQFADAQSAGVSDISVGDQMRARGEKSPDGSRLDAREIIFGTFVIEAGTVTDADPSAQTIRVKQLGTNKLLTVKLTASSQIKRMLAMPPMGGGAPGMFPGGAPAAPGGQTARAGGMPGGRGFDINQMIDHLPLIRIDDLKPGATVVVTSTKGAKPDQLTAILVLSNADMLIQMATMMTRSGGAGAGAGVGGAPGMGGANGVDLGGLMGLGIGGINQ